MSAPPSHPPVSPTGPHVPSRPTAPRADRSAPSARPSRQAAPNANPQPGSRWVTAAYAASVLGLSKMSIYRLIHTGQLAHTTLDGAFRIPLSALEAHISGPRRRSRG
jgi:excisionase family DNA binding protein